MAKGLAELPLDLGSGFSRSSAAVGCQAQEGLDLIEPVGFHSQVLASDGTLHQFGRVDPATLMSRCRQQRRGSRSNAALGDRKQSLRLEPGDRRQPPNVER